MLSADDQQLENDSRAPRHSLPKWPFLIGDVVLVLVALAVWFSTAELSATQLLFCLGSVGLGAVIFVLPYVLENIPAGVEAFFASNNAAKSELAGSSPLGEGEWRRQARAAAEAVEHAVRANAALESSARRIDSRFAPLVEVHQGLTAAVAELREATAARATTSTGETLAMQRELERVRKEQTEKFKAVEEKMAVLGEALAILAGYIKAASSRQAPSPNPIEALPHSKEQSMAQAEKPSAMRVEEPVFAGPGIMEMAPSLASISAAADPGNATMLGEIVDQPVHEIPASSKVGEPSLEDASMAAARVGHPPVIEPETIEEKSMLAKALARAQSSGETPAVAGIMARSRRPRKSKFPLPVVVAAREVEPEPVASATAVSPGSSANSVEQEGWSSLAEGKLDEVTTEESSSPERVLDRVADEPLAEPAAAVIEQPTAGDTNSAFRRLARAKVISLREDDEKTAEKDTSVVLAPDHPEESPAELANVSAQGELLAREAETIRKKRSSRIPLQACSLTARVLIGIGNKPFVRGTGPGLSMEKGVAMEFVEIGQWRWVAPEAVKEPITMRIFKNDEIPAEGDALVLHPGQSLDISPVFPN